MLREMSAQHAAVLDESEVLAHPVEWRLGISG